MSSIDLDALSDDTLAHLTRALASYSRVVPLDQVKPEFIALGDAVLKAQLERRRPVSVDRSGQETTGGATPVAARYEGADGGDVPIYLTRTEYAKRMGVSLRTVDRLIGRGVVVGCVRLGRSVRIPISAITATNAPGAP